MTVVCVAGSRRQARAVYKYVEAIIAGNQDFKRQVVRQTNDTLEFKNGTSIEVYPATHRIRGLTAVACVCDEIGTWNYQDDATLPDTEIISSVLRPALATTQGPLIAISSPHTRRGALWQAYRDHFGCEGDAILVARAESQVMNPRIDARWLARQFSLDPQAAAAEFGVTFRTDIETLFVAEAIRDCMDDARERAPRQEITYTAFCDPSGGAGDAMTLAIAHATGKQVWLDCLAEVEGRFVPAAVVARFAETLRRYGCYTLYGDAYGKEWVATAFREHGVEYRSPTRDGSEAKLSKSELYLELLPMINSRQAVLLNNARLERQLCLLERSAMGASGRERVDHPRGSHDDLANAAAGVLIMARQRGDLAPFHRLPAYGVGKSYDVLADAAENQRALAREEARLGRFSGPGHAPTFHGDDDRQQQAFGL